MGKFFVTNAFRLYFGIKVHGAEHVPQNVGLVVAANHISAFDPPVLGISVPRLLSVMAKKELFENVLLRTLLRCVHGFPIDRSKSDMSAMKQAIRKLKSGDAVGIFIQGTRNTGDVAAQNGAAYLAQRSDVAILPTAIWREGRAFHVRFGESINAQSKSKEAMQDLTAKTMASINAMLP